MVDDTAKLVSLLRAEVNVPAGDNDRLVDKVKLANYVVRQLDGRSGITSDELGIGSINDLCCYQRLLLIASRDDAPLQLRRHDPVMQMLRGIRVRFEDERMTNNDYMTHRRFVVEREGV